MFGITIKEKLFKTITSLCLKNIGKYKADVYKICKKYKSFVSAEGETEEEMKNLRKAYLDSVLNEALETIGHSSSNIAARLQLVLLAPEMSGYPNTEFENGVMAGAVYAFCYWAIKNKMAKSSDCLLLNHLQNKIMNDALNEISELFE